MPDRVQGEVHVGNRLAATVESTGQLIEVGNNLLSKYNFFVGVYNNPANIGPVGMHPIDDASYLQAAYSWGGMTMLVVLSLVPVVGVIVAVYVILLLLHFLKTAVIVKANVLAVADPFQNMIGPLSRTPTQGLENEFLKFSISNQTHVDAFIGVLSDNEASAVRARMQVSETPVGEVSKMMYTASFKHNYFGLRDLYLDGKYGVALGFCCMWSIVLSILITSRAV